MNWAIGIDMYTLMCIKLMTNKILLYLKKKKNIHKNQDKLNMQKKRQLECSMQQDSTL